MSDGVDIDLYADVEHEFTQEDVNYNSTVDLYDDMLQPPRPGTVSRQPSTNGSAVPSSPLNLGLQYNYQGKKVAIYVGNLTWWTTDKDLQKAINSLGVTDLVEIKFYENRANGQSKGFAVVHLASESSSRTVMEKLPQKDLHGQSPVVTPCNRQSLSQFEQQSKAQSGGSTPSPKPAPPTPAFTQPPRNAPPPQIAPQAQTSILGNPPVFPPRGPPPPFPPPFSQGTIVTASTATIRGFPPMPPPGVPPPGVQLPGIPPRMAPPPGLFPPGSILAPPPRLPPPSLNMVPRMLVPPPGVRLPPPPASFISQLVGQIPPPAIPQQTLPPPSEEYQQRGRSQSPPLSEAEVDDIMTRNRVVSSSAISRAVSDASSGDYAGAIETLVTAISLIKQSKVAGDERAKVLIGSLQDCLHGIEDKSFGSGTQRKRDRSRDREERPRHRESKSRRRDRDRSRSRERYDERDYRDRSRDRDYSRHSDRHRR